MYIYILYIYTYIVVYVYTILLANYRRVQILVRTDRANKVSKWKTSLKGQILSNLAKVVLSVSQRSAFVFKWLISEVNVPLFLLLLWNMEWIRNWFDTIELKPYRLNMKFNLLSIWEWCNHVTLSFIPLSVC